MIRYGEMPEYDYQTLTKTLDLVCFYFGEGVINTLELGVRDGRGSRGIRDFFCSKRKKAPAYGCG